MDGPFSNGIISTIEYDYAHCFASGFWPSCDSSWIDRCHSWPPSHVVNDIVRSGCHFVSKYVILSQTSALVAYVRRSEFAKFENFW